MNEKGEQFPPPILTWVQSGATTSYSLCVLNLLLVLFLTQASFLWVLWKMSERSFREKCLN